jgi:hypothetical protein
MTSVAKNTVTKLLVELGTACAAYQSEMLRNLPCKRLQCDEIWSFVGAKDRNVPADEDSTPWQGLLGYLPLRVNTALPARTPCEQGQSRDVRESRLAVDSARSDTYTYGHTTQATLVDLRAARASRSCQRSHGARFRF